VASLPLRSLDSYRHHLHTTTKQTPPLHSSTTHTPPLQSKIAHTPQHSTITHTPLHSTTTNTPPPHTSTLPPPPLHTTTPNSDCNMGQDAGATHCNTLQHNDLKFEVEVLSSEWLPGLFRTVVMGTLLQLVAVCCGALQCIAVSCSDLQCVR